MAVLKRREPEGRFIRFVTVVFHSSGRQYTYKTLFPKLNPGDKVVVQTARGNTIGEIFNDRAEEPSFECKWVLSKINLDDVEKEFLQKLKTYGIKE